MHIIVIIDDDYGMMFNHRRQSKDATLRKNILELVGNGRLLMNAYTFDQFSNDYPPKGGIIAVNDPVISVCEDFPEWAGEDDFCLVENTSINKYHLSIQKIIVYKWNRKYPSDVKFDFPEGEWVIESAVDFHGNSHDRITREIWCRK